MFVHNIDPVLFDVGPFEIRYYGIAYVLAFLAVFFFLKWYVRKYTIENFKEDDVADFLILLLVSMIVGARFFHVFVYNFGYYMSNPSEIIMIWNGGLAFHGGLVGILIAAYFYLKKKKINFYDLADVIVIPLAFGLALGRIANFINGELVGIKTNIGWCVKFPGYEGCKHPVVLYESVKNIFIGIVLIFVHFKGKFAKGTVFWSFIALYGFLRFMAQFLRANEIMIGPFDLPQYFSLLMLLVGGVMLYMVKSKSYLNTL